MRPWTLSVNEGDRSINLSYDDLLDMFDLEEEFIGYAALKPGQW